MRRFAVVLLILAACMGCRKRVPDAYYMTGDPSAGGKAFLSKGCMNCHSINGVGGEEARDLGRPADSLMTAAAVMTSMWNHGPEMRKKISGMNLPYPELTPKDTTDLLAFLFNATYFNDQGSYAGGRVVLNEKGCLQCHSTEKNDPKSIISWGRYLHPVIWIQKMWNHAPSMARAMKEKKIEWPEFTSQEMADLLTYLNAKSPLLKDVEGLFPADPEDGKRLFAQKGCGSCHGENGKAVDLMQPSGKTRSMISLAAAMWNHYPEMAGQADAEGSMPTFEKKEMSNMVAYIFTTRYFDVRGDIEAGKKVYREKECADCHDAGQGPPLKYFRGRCTPAYMITQMWNHGPLMQQKIEEKKMQWPMFETEQMVNLLSYLNEQG